MKAECETNDHDDKDNGDGKEGVDDVLEEDDVFPDSVQEPHVEEQVDPAKGDGDGTCLPVQAGTMTSSTDLYMLYAGTFRIILCSWFIFCMILKRMFKKVLQN